MADNDEREEVAPRGNEWEVVSLTASAYAAAPGPEQVGVSHDSGKKPSDSESSRAMFMSGHFVFPPSQHENLPLEPDFNEMNDEKGGELDATAADEGDDLSTEEIPAGIIKGSVPIEFAGIPIFDDEGNILSPGDADFENTQSNSDFSSLQSDTKFGKSSSVERGEGTIVGVEPDDESSDSVFSEFPERKNHSNDDFPYEAWWKKKAISFYSLAKETNTFWSVFVAAAVMGLVILGHRWQQERWQVLHLKRFSPGDERTSRFFSPISRLRDVVIGGHVRGSLLRGAATNER